MSPSANTLNSEELARYSRHILLDEIGVSGQESLKKSRVLVIGAGGLGSPAAMYLAAAGIGTLGIADFDKVELHNLQRQLLHGTKDVDNLKTESARARLSDINPHVSVILHDSGVTPENVISLFDQYDIIVDGSDNFGTRYLNNDAAYFSNTPLVYGSIFKFEGQVSVFNDTPDAPCYRCLFPDPPPPGSVPNCGEAGVLGALCGIIGSMQALEAIKQVLQIGESLSSGLLVLDTLSMRTRKLKIKKDPHCPLCGNAPEISEIRPELYQFNCDIDNTETENMENEPYPIEIDVSEANRLLQTGKAALIDVREPYENDICKIEGSILIPMNTIPANLDQVPTSDPVMLCCHHGSRSMQVTQYLRQNGYPNAINMAGGIDAWAREIDTRLQRY
jgi:adenylyltransferase/sulfurtransferase